MNNRKFFKQNGQVLKVGDRQELTFAEATQLAREQGTPYIYCLNYDGGALVKYSLGPNGQLTYVNVSDDEIVSELGPLHPLTLYFIQLGEQFSPPVGYELFSLRGV